MKLGYSLDKVIAEIKTAKGFPTNSAPRRLPDQAPGPA
jgi:hypothetical protein